MFSSLSYLLWKTVPKCKELSVIADIILDLIITPYQCLKGLRVQNIEIKTIRSIQQSGFTLVEIIAVLAIIAILASLSMPRFIDLSTNASHRGLQKAIVNLNSQELLIWTKIKSSETGWIDDESLFLQIDTNLGDSYKWSPQAQFDGGILHFKDQMVKLKRNLSTTHSSGSWEIIFTSN